jgi:hypothetical protein
VNDIETDLALEQLPPPTRPVLMQCSSEGCNRWVWTHSRTPLGFIFKSRIWCAEHIPVHE